MSLRSGKRPLAAAFVLMLAVAACGKKDENAVDPRIDAAVQAFAFTNQDGTTQRLADLRGKPVLIAFIYTRCPIPAMCPMTTKSVALVQEALTPEEREKIALVTLTFDPEYDTPTVMQSYGEAYNADFSNWHFWTGDEKQTNELMGLYDAWAEKVAGKDEYSHNMKGAILNADGTFSRELAGSQWDTDEVVAHLRSLITHN
ncbi:MAG: SCO family protein [Candidatus Poribacteria bacterium]|nr:SCO family protein [Candidatus Poribacteria bacterium]